MHHLIHSEKCVVGQFHHCVNIIGYTYTNLDDIVNCTARLCDIAYCSVGDVEGKGILWKVTSECYLIINS